MNEAQAIRELPRTSARIFGELETARVHFNALCDLAADCINTQLPSIFVIGDTVQPIEYDIPENLRAALRDAAEQQMRLQQELVTAMDLESLDRYR